MGNSPSALRLRRGRTMGHYGLDRPFDADRLPNGHTLVAHSGEVAEYDAKGKKVWSAKMTHPVEVNRY